MSIRFSRDVKEAMSNGRPVVALESTLITHGLPRPENASVGRMLEQEARNLDVVPATIAIIDGEPRVGLEDSELEHLAALTTARKCSLRDIPVALARNETGGPTVAATMWLAREAGISVFATGGIGGVHRGHHQGP